MTAGVVLHFPIHPVRLVPTEDGWLVEWRGCGWLHATKSAAVTDAKTIAAAHGERVLDCSGHVGGNT
jgi:hypothetical protein